MGFWSLRERNKACIAKLCWRLKTRHLIWTGMVKKQLKKCTDNNSVKGSKIVREIVKTMDWVDQNCSCRLRSGNQCKFWSDNWAHGGIPSKFIYGPLTKEMMQINVASAWLDVDSWNEEIIGYPIDESIKQKLGSHILTQDSRADIWAWRMDVSGEVTTRSAYESLMEENIEDFMHDKNNWIWKTKTYPKIQFFVWRCWKNCIPTRQQLLRRGMTVDPLCPLCGNELEDSTHLFMNCRWTKDKWMSLNATPLFLSTFSLPLKDWLEANAKTRTKHDSPHPAWSTTFCFALWYIWKARNDCIFRNGFLRNDWNYIVRTSAHEFWATIRKPKNIQTCNEIFNWSMPSGMNLKINVDAAFNPERKYICVAGCARDMNGICKGGFGKKINASSPMEAEFWGIYWGLQMAQQFPDQTILMETDSLEVVNLIKNKEINPDFLPNFIIACRQLIQTTPWVHLSWTPREDNSIAHDLAQGCATVDNDFTFTDSIPMHIFSVFSPSIKELLSLSNCSVSFSNVAVSQLSSVPG